jgi:hypothetical protein
MGEEISRGNSSPTSRTLQISTESYLPAHSSKSLVHIEKYCVLMMLSKFLALPVDIEK